MSISVVAPGPIIETARLWLRPLTMDDLPDLHAIYCEPEVRRYFPDPVLTYAETEEELHYLLQYYPTHGFGLWATIEKASGQFIGRCGLLPWMFEGRLEVEVAYLLSHRVWRRGLGFEAAQACVTYARDTLQVPRVICLMMPGNQASIAVARKLGMSLERERAVEGLPVYQYTLRFEEAS